MKNFDQVLIGAYSIAWYEVSERMRTPQLMYVLNRDSLNITFFHPEEKFVWIFSSEENSWRCDHKPKFSSQNFPADAFEVKPSTGKSKPISRVIIDSLRHFDFSASSHHTRREEKRKPSSRKKRAAP